MKLISLFSFLVFCLEASPCQIDISSKILFLKKPRKLSHIKKILSSHENCSDEQLLHFFNIIYGINGAISSAHINRLMIEENIESKISLKQKKLEIVHLENIIKDRINLKDGLVIQNLKAIGPIYAIKFEKISDIQLECHGCHSVGMKNINIFYDLLSNQYRQNIWVSARILEFQEVVVASSDIRPSNREGLLNYVDIIPMGLDHSGQYLKSVNRLEYFKVNKYIKKGTPLKQSDIIPKRLVSAGAITSVIIDQNGLKLKFKAIARESGKYGDFIDLYNQKSKKKIRGEIVGFNRVKVEI